MTRTKRSTADLNKTSGPSPTTSILAALMAAPTTALADLKSVTPVAEMPVGEPWDSIRVLQGQRSQVHKFSGAILNALFTERRAVFPLARPSFDTLIRQPNSINHGAISGTDFKDFRAFLITNGIVRELRAPVAAKMPGLYVLAHAVFAPLLSPLLGGDTMAKAELRAIGEWDAQLQKQETKESTKESTSSLLSSSVLFCSPLYFSLLLQSERDAGSRRGSKAFYFSRAPGRSSRRRSEFDAGGNGRSQRTPLAGSDSSRCPGEEEADAHEGRAAGVRAASGESRPLRWILAGGRVRRVQGVRGVEVDPDEEAERHAR